MKEPIITLSSMFKFNCALTPQCYECKFFIPHNPPDDYYGYCLEYHEFFISSGYYDFSCPVRCGK